MKSIESPEDRIENVFRLRSGENYSQKKSLHRLGIETVRDLLYHFPSRYITVSGAKYIKDLKAGDHAVLFGKVHNLETKKTFKKKMPLAKGVLEDDTGTIEITWFNQPYIAKMLPEGQLVKMEGNVQERSGKLYLANPEYERVATIPEKIGGSLFSDSGEAETFSIPVYPEVRGITSRWLHHKIAQVLSTSIPEKINDPIPERFRAEFNLPDLQTALVWIHRPEKESHARAAKKRFAFEEIFLIQILNQKRRAEYEAQDSFKIDVKRKLVNEFIDRFPFDLTDAQLRAINEILDDFSTPHAMSRLLEGDVGSGKTAVAATSAYTVTSTPPEDREFGNLQTAYMAPTSILARQHFESFIEYFSHLPINIALITGDECRKFPSKTNPEESTHISRTQLLKWISDGTVPIVIGTHALIYKTVEFKNLAYVIVDEQHRFGVNQRKNLTRKDGPLPHFLSMSATPIPRTLALTIYGDLDLSILDEMPRGRTMADTQVVAERKRQDTYDFIREKLKEGRQAYVICPRIAQADPTNEKALDLHSVESESKRLKKEFPDFSVGILHGRMKPQDKERVMQKFLDQEIDILVSTTVIEVGVNVPNATMIVVENAERFGLAQLHQLRGRVMRSARDSFCFLFTSSKNDNTLKRLDALQTAESGFELAEADLKLRGAGELLGKRQSGMSDVAMDSIKNLRMVEAARKSAKAIFTKDPKLNNYPAIQERITQIEKQAHFE